MTRQLDIIDNLVAERFSKPEKIRRTLLSPSRSDL